MAKGKLKTKLKKAKGLLETLVSKIDSADIPIWLEATGFLGLLYMYYIWEKSTLFGPSHNFQNAMKLALPQAALDYLLLKSHTEIGAATAVAHIGVRASAEVFEGILKTQFREIEEYGEELQRYGRILKGEEEPQRPRIRFR